MNLCKNLLLTLFVATNSYIHVNGQAAENKKEYKYNNFYDLSLTLGDQQYSSALGWSHLHGIGKKKKFKIGYGIRFTSYLGSKQLFITAPARLTRNVEGPKALFVEEHKENFDTLAISQSQVNMLNVSIHLLYSFTDKWDIGFNIDAAGLSFGEDQQGIYSTYQGISPQITENAKPTKGNLLLGDDNDIGNLNSELFARYWLSSKWGIKLGYTHLFAEYTTYRKLNFQNDRFRNKTHMVLLGISYSPFR